MPSRPPPRFPLPISDSPGGHRLALVTGTSSGIGEGVARELVARGWSVVGISRRPAAIEAADYAHLSLDLSDLPAMMDIVQRELGPVVAAPELERVCVVSSAADPGLLGPVDTVDPVGVQRAYTVNAVAPMWLMGWVVRKSPPHVRVRIVNVTSGAGVAPFPGLATYGSAKAALRMAGMTFAAELDLRESEGGQRRDVTIVSYSPGRVDTPMQALARASSSETLPIRDTFTKWQAEGMLIPPEAPAAEIVEYVESDGHPRFFEARVGDGFGSAPRKGVDQLPHAT